MSACAKCSKPLEVEIEPDDDDDDDDDCDHEDGGDVQMGGGDWSSSHTVPDDVHLPCNHHFHWECLLEAYELDKCPACARDITSAPAVPSSSSAPVSNPQIVVNLNNEGGLQENIDIFPLLQEEAYLRAYPEQRKCRAFLEFCREGDHRAIAELLKTCSEDADDGDEGPAPSADQVLRCQDSIGDMQSGLHAAAANGHREVAWLLLLLASEYPEMEFPALVFQEAAALGVMRGELDCKVDIRSLRDGQGRTAEDVARQAGVVWNGWIGNGRLAMP